MTDELLYQLWYRRRINKRWLKGITPPQPYKTWTDKGWLRDQQETYPDHLYCIRRVGESPNGRC